VTGVGRLQKIAVNMEPPILSRDHSSLAMDHSGIRGGSGQERPKLENTEAGEVVTSTINQGYGRYPRHARDH